MPPFKLNPTDCFHARQIWESPRGTQYRVISVARGGKAVLRAGTHGRGKKIIRDWDDVVNWVLRKDAQEILFEVTVSPNEDSPTQILTFTNRKTGGVDGFMTISYATRMMCTGQVDPSTCIKDNRLPTKNYSGRGFKAEMIDDALAFYADLFGVDVDAILLLD